MRGTAILFAFAAALAAVPRAEAAEPLKAVYDKAQILRLPEDAAHIVVGNPAILDVTVETPRLLFLFGKKQGETSITILDAGRREILSRPVVVTAEDERHVTVHTSAKNGTGTVETIYSCSGRCAKVLAPDPAAMASPAPVAPAAQPPAQPAGGAQGQQGGN
jgi:hypothetical protein